MSSFPNLYFKNNEKTFKFLNNHYENNAHSATLPIIEDCLTTRYHDIGCLCINCRNCIDEIKDYYKKKNKKKISNFKKKYIKSMPIPIKNSIKKNNNDDIFLAHSLPTGYTENHKEQKNILDEKCILCPSSNNLKLYNNFYFLCKDCQNN